MWETAVARRYSQDCMLEANTIDSLTIDSLEPELEGEWTAASLPSVSCPTSRSSHEHGAIARLVRILVLLVS